MTFEAFVIGFTWREVDRMFGRRGVYVLALQLLAAACLTPEGAMAAQGSGRPRYIAVLKFKNLKPNSDTDWIGESAAETLSTKLTGLPGLVSVERLQVASVIEEHNFQQLDLTRPSDAVKVGKFVGAERVVVGTYVCDGDMILFNVRVIDVPTSAILIGATAKAPRKKIFDTVFQLAEAVIQSFDKAVDVVDSRPVVREAAAGERIAVSDEQKQLLRKRGATDLKAFEAYGRGKAAADTKEKIQWYTKAIQLDPRYAEAYAGRGLEYYRSGDWERAIADYNRLIELDPKSPVAYNNRGLFYAGKGDCERALADYERAIALNPNYPLAYNNRGLVHIRRGDYDLAIADYDRAIKLNPDYALAYYNRGLGHSHKKDYDKAIADYNMALELKPDDARAYTNRAVAYYYEHDYERALADYNKAISLGADLPEAYSGRGAVYRRNGQLDLAILDFNKAIDLNPDYHLAYANRGSAYRDKGDYERAIADYNKAIELNPESSSLYRGRSFIYWCGESFDKAALDLRKAIELDPENANAHIWLFWARARMGEDGKGELLAFLMAQKEDKWPAPVMRMCLGEITPEECLAAAADKDPDVDKEQKCVAYYSIGQLFLMRGDPNTAAAYFEKCLATGVSHFYAYTGAEVELKRLGKR